MKASPSRPFILGVTKPSQKDVQCQVAKPHQSNGQLKPSLPPSSKLLPFPRQSSASIAGKRACTLTKSSNGKRSPCRVSSAVQSKTSHTPTGPQRQTGNKAVTPRVASQGESAG